MFHHMSNRYWLSFKILLWFIFEHILKNTQRAVKEERIIITFGHNRGIKERSLVSEGYESWIFRSRGRMLYIENELQKTRFLFRPYTSESEVHN